MRTIERTNRFTRDYKRVRRGVYGSSLDQDLGAILQLLVLDRTLDFRYRDHALAGKWNGYRDCHVRPDLVLIYRKVGADVLRLARLGSHSELAL